MKQIKVTGMDWYKFIDAVPFDYKVDFNIYNSHNAVYIVSREKPYYIVSIELTDIEMITITDDSLVLHCTIGHIVLLYSGNIIAQFGQEWNIPQFV